jgi:tetratricopeptide (TPR) repeat protein
MDTEVKNLFDKASKTPDVSEVFAKDMPKEVAAEDVFAGNDELFKAIENANRPQIIVQAENVGQAAASAMSRISAAHIILIVNVVVISGIVGYLLLRPGAPASQTVSEGTGTTTIVGLPDTLTDLTVSKSMAATLDKAISWELAEQFYEAGDYPQAYYIFSQLTKNLIPNTVADQFMKDFLMLRMALCLQNSDNQAGINRLFNTALKSRAPVVRALASYNLMFNELNNNRYLSARKHAYKTLALLDSFKENFPESMSSDCYFTIGEALTRQVLTLNNTDDLLPGQRWANSLRIMTIPQMTQHELRSFLQTGIYQLSDGAVVPIVAKRPAMSVGSQWSAVSVNAPLSEVISRFASASEMNVSWMTALEAVKDRPITVYLPTSSQQRLAEVVVGSSGLIARFDGDDNIFIHDPGVYGDLNEYKSLITREAVATWQRFRQIYRGDHRIPNAHYALGMLQEYAGQTPTALSEYKYLSSRFSHNELAPYALLNASKLKTNLHDYTGAKEDLDELIIQHPDTNIVDQASLYLSEATMMMGNYDDAIKMFRKVYNLDMNKESQRKAAYGLGRCFFEKGDSDETANWLTHAINMTDNAGDHRLQSAYFMLGKSQVALEQYEQASLAFRKALGGSISQEDYVQAVLKLSEAEVLQEKYVVALNILENVPLTQLTPEESCDVIIAKADILRQIDLYDTAGSLLRRKMQFIANSYLRARLSVELAKCHIEMEDYEIARKRLTDAIYDLPSGDLAQHANIMLASVSMEMNDYEMAQNICLKLLSYSKNEEVRIQTFNMLGDIYTHFEQYDSAALAYAGVSYSSVKDK